MKFRDVERGSKIKVGVKVGRKLKSGIVLFDGPRSRNQWITLWRWKFWSAPMKMATSPTYATLKIVDAKINPQPTNQMSEEKEYRPLNPDEVIQEGDEYWSRADNKWGLCLSTIGMKVKIVDYISAFRRPIPPEPKEPCPECDGTGQVHSHNSRCPDCAGSGIKGFTRSSSTPEPKREENWTYREAMQYLNGLSDLERECITLRTRAELAEQKLAEAEKDIQRILVASGQDKPHCNADTIIEGIRHMRLVIESNRADVLKYEELQTERDSIRLENAALRKAVELVARDIRTTMYRLSKPAEDAVRSVANVDVLKASAITPEQHFQGGSFTVS